MSGYSIFNQEPIIETSLSPIWLLEQELEGEKRKLKILLGKVKVWLLSCNEFLKLEQIGPNTRALSASLVFISSWKAISNHWLQKCTDAVHVMKQKLEEEDLDNILERAWEILYYWRYIRHWGRSVTNSNGHDTSKLKFTLDNEDWSIWIAFSEIDEILQNVAKIYRNIYCARLLDILTKSCKNHEGPTEWSQKNIQRLNQVLGELNGLLSQVSYTVEQRLHSAQIKWGYTPKDAKALSRLGPIFDKVRYRMQHMPDISVSRESIQEDWDKKNKGAERAQEWNKQKHGAREWDKDKKIEKAKIRDILNALKNWRRSYSDCSRTEIINTINKLRRMPETSATKKAIRDLGSINFQRKGKRIPKKSASKAWVKIWQHLGETR